MWRTAFSLSTFITAVLIVAGDAASVNMSTSISDLTQEIVMSLIVNQMAILKDMNESSYLCASRDREFREIRLWKEEAKQQLQAIEDNLREKVEDAQARMQNMTEEIRDNLRGMAEDAQSRMQALEEDRQQALEERAEAQQQELERMEALQQTLEERVEALQQTLEERAEMRQQTLEERVEALQQTLEERVEARQQTLEERAEALQQMLEERVEALQRVNELQDAMNTLHNDTEPSQCGVGTKILHGGKGSVLSYYSFSLDCNWRVVLPSGTRPIFHLELLEERCEGCDCGFVQLSEVRGLDIKRLSRICPRDILVHGWDAYNVTTNEFLIHFENNFFTKGFHLYYESVFI
ncbi:hypothetical protein O3P69_014412 [Scylla paramamosain]|uniref:CUB domain-containing protein n=1 Tax=Scylla paramamosain TaxID=85552 RepID=A0AAW0TB83_SCYPA